MELPPSGWYPDPYGVPGLLRWWDGAAWTEHTHAEPTATAPAAAAVTSGADPATVAPAVTPAVTSVQPAVYEPPVTRVQPATVAPTTVEPAAIAPAVQPAAVQPGTVQPATVQPGVQLSALRPPAGPRTVPQPAIPASMGGGSLDGTRVLLLDENAWAAHGAPPLREGGYYRAQRRRRTLAAAGLAAGVAAALAVIGLVVHNLGQSGGTAAADTTPAASAVAPSSAAASPTPPASPTASPSATSMATVTDATSGLTYGQLPSPFEPGCPADLTTPSFTWTAGESAAAGQVNNGQTTWYGEACSGQLPAQYGYSGTTDLQNVATTLVNTFNGTYYAALPHTMAITENEPTAISGHPGWEIQFLVTYTSPQGLPFTNELGTVVVADPQTGAAPAVFFASIPENLNEANVATLISSLQLAAVAPAPSTPATTPSSGTGSQPAAP